MSSRRLIGTRRGWWTTGGTLGSSVIWHSPWKFPMPWKHSGYWAIKSCLSLKGDSSFGWSGELLIVCAPASPLVWMCCVCIVQLNWKRLRSVDVGKPRIAGPGVSDIEWCIRVLASVGAGNSDYTMMVDPWISISSEHNIWGWQSIGFDFPIPVDLVWEHLTVRPHGEYVALGVPIRTLWQTHWNWHEYFVSTRLWVCVCQVCDGDRHKNDIFKGGRGSSTLWAFYSVNLLSAGFWLTDLCKVTQLLTI